MFWFNIAFKNNKKIQFSKTEYNLVGALLRLNFSIENLIFLFLKSLEVEFLSTGFVILLYIKLLLVLLLT